MLSERCSKMFCHNSGSEVMSTLKRRLSQYNLKRKKVDVDLSYVAEIDTKRAGWPRHHFWLQPRDVAYIGCVVWLVIPLTKVRPSWRRRAKRHKLKRRKYNSPGPNYYWHVDGNDKLKPFYFPIRGAVDCYRVFKMIQRS